MKINYAFEVLEEVYHLTPESPKGIIIGRRVYTDPYFLIEYNVAFGHLASDSLWCQENELTTERVIV